MSVSPRSIVQKADLAVSDLTSDGGYLNPEQANTFIRTLIEQPTIINQLRVVRMSAPKRKVEKIGFGSRILKPAPSSGTALDDADRSKPTTATVELETKEVIAEVWLPYDVLEDNIERGNLQQTILTLIAQRAALDLEELIIKGDTSQSADSYLELTDGIIQLAGNEVDAAAVTDINKALFKMALNNMPDKYLRNKSMMRNYVSHSVELEYRDSLADRGTDLGDRTLTGNGPVSAYGVPVEGCALMPDDKLVLTYPQNILFGIQRDIQIELDRDIRRRVMVIVLTMRCDVQLEEADAAVVCTGFSDSAI